MHHADGACADDEYAVPGPGARFFISIENTGHRLNQCVLCETYVVGNRKNVALLNSQRRDAYKLSKCAIFMDSQCAVIRIEVSLACDSEVRREGIVIGSDAHPVAHSESSQALSHLFERSRHLVANNKRRDSVPMLEHSDIRAAYT